MPLVFDLLRHGEAAPDPASDATRRLTPRGEQSLRDLGERLASQDWRPERAFASPYRRAQDTARIVTRAAGLQIAIETLAELEPDVSPSDVFQALGSLGIVAGHVLLVGHQPQMGGLSQALAGAESGFRPGDLVRITCGETWGDGSGRIVVTLRAG